MNICGIGEAGDISRGIGVVVGADVCVSETVGLTVEMTVSMTSIGLVVGVDLKLLQDARNPGARNKGINILHKIFTFQPPLMFYKEAAKYGHHCPREFVSRVCP